MTETEEGAKVGPLRFVLCGERWDPGKVESVREPRSQFLCSAGERPGEGQVVWKRDQSARRLRFPADAGQGGGNLHAIRGPVEEEPVSWCSLKNTGSDYLVQSSCCHLLVMWLQASSSSVPQFPHP